MITFENTACRRSRVVADLEDDVVPGREHVVELVRVDLEQDRGHSKCDPTIVNPCRAPHTETNAFHKLHNPQHDYVKMMKHQKYI